MTETKKCSGKATDPRVFKENARVAGLPNPQVFGRIQNPRNFRGGFGNEKK